MGKDFMAVELLPARHGDCLWIEYGNTTAPNRILIDGGPIDTFPRLAHRIQKAPLGQRVFELIILTHVDADHVEGLVRFFADKPPQMTTRQVWFNGWRQMKRSHGLLGAMQGEFLSALLLKRARNAWNPDTPPWVVPGTGNLPAFMLDGGLKLTLLSPDAPKLASMAKAWEKAVVKGGISPGDLEAAWEKLGKQKRLIAKGGLLGITPNLDTLVRAQFIEDQAKPNGSSIAVLAEYGDKSALLLGDAHPAVVTASIRRLCAERNVGRLKVDAVKVAHHGSKNNTSVALVKLIDSPRWLISTNGDQFGHPDEACIARILTYGRPQELWFNYRSVFTQPWLAEATQEKYNYNAIVRKDTDTSLVAPL